MNSEPEMKQAEKKTGQILKWLLIVAGTFSVGLGVVGITLPILPTTPFLLVAAACYARSSTRFYNWLMNNRIFGSYIRNYREGNGMPLKLKTITLILLWLTILFSVLVIIDILLVDIILITIASAVTIHIVMIKTYRG